MNELVNVPTSLTLQNTILKQFILTFVSLIISSNTTWPHFYYNMVCTNSTLLFTLLTMPSMA